MSLAAMLLAGLDGIESRTDTAANDFGPFDMDVATQDEAFRRRLKPLPRSLPHALAALSNDHDFLFKGGVFTAALIDHWIHTKRVHTAQAVGARPHPYEYNLYLDV